MGAFWTFAGTDQIKLVLLYNRRKLKMWNRTRVARTPSRLAPGDGEEDDFIRLEKQTHVSEEDGERWKEQFLPMEQRESRWSGSRHWQWKQPWFDGQRADRSVSGASTSLGKLPRPWTRGEPGGVTSCSFVKNFGPPEEFAKIDRPLKYINLTTGNKKTRGKLNEI